MYLRKSISNCISLFLSSFYRRSLGEFHQKMTETFFGEKNQLILGRLLAGRDLRSTYLAEADRYIPPLLVGPVSNFDFPNRSRNFPHFCQVLSQILTFPIGPDIFPHFCSDFSQILTFIVQADFSPFLSRNVSNFDFVKKIFITV